MDYNNKKGINAIGGNNFNESNYIKKKEIIANFRNISKNRISNYYSMGSFELVLILFLGGISAVFNAAYPGIVIQAVLATFAAMFTMLALYRLRVIQCTDKFRSVIYISTISIAVLYLIQWIASFFHYSIPAIFGAGTIGIGFSVIVVGIAALNLILDFDFIERGAQNMLPKDYEWFGAFGLMVTLVWLYVEMLRLLAKLRDR